MGIMLWCIVGLLLILFEFAVSGLVIVFFGVASLIVGALLLIAPLALAWQLTVWAVLSVALVWGCRKFFARIFKGSVSTREMVPEELDCAGKNARVVEYHEDSRCGKVDFQGALWNARFETPHRPGESVIVLRRDNITLIIR